MAKGLSKGEFAKEVKKRNPNIRAHNFRFGRFYAPRQTRPNPPDLLCADTWIGRLSQGSFMFARDANAKKTMLLINIRYELSQLSNIVV